ncbi:hypothetical protein SVIO_057980 [Streptomyces violaceusniger]|uniref:Uncharacterized protein n=1 Tax=Streptomyces violaceusniger TaxID=68280 RepID=A0A4D4L1X3_STRVO|nr:hypothetical protein SVIO_057980 [Streptomyces violaceusniger]
MWCGVVVEFSAGEGDPFGEAEQAEPRCRWLCGLRGGRGVADADVESVARCSLEGDVHVCARGVFGGVGQSFLDDPVAGSSDDVGRCARHGGERDDADGSWARASATWIDPPTVHQGGPQRLWTVLERIRHRLNAEGGLPIYGSRVHITPDGVCHFTRGKWSASYG